MTTAGLVCGSCGTELPSDSRFCNSCGAPVTPAKTSAEYKQVTVLFADVVRSMDIAAAVGLERLREVMTELVDRSAAVVRHFGGTAEFTGDGVMAVFGAPVALEDHALRACLAALGIQDEVKRLGCEVHARDGVDLLLRVGLNSGRVIVGEIGSGLLGYAAMGEQVGMAQRMESVAPPGGVILSASTARLVDGAVALAEPQMVRIKGADRPVMTRRLLAVVAHPAQVGSPGTTLVGREWELHTVASLVERSISGRGSVVGVTGPPGIGKSRLVYEATASARRRGVEVCSTFCESHAADIPFHVVGRLLRDVAGIADVDDEEARRLVRSQVPDASDEDVLLLNDLLGIGDPGAALPTIDPDARRRRLSALINSVSLARTDPVVYVIEDVHWIDGVSESMFADFLGVIAQTHSVVLITYRPEYAGTLTRIHGAQTISLAPLTDREIAQLLDELLGADASVAAIGALIAGRAAGNPFFVEEMVRELAERGVLEGHRGGYTCGTDIADVCVPATLQAAIAARIDRLEPAAKRTLSAAAVIGSRFTPELVSALGIDPVVDELARVELIDQVRFNPSAEFAFRQPLIRAVAYESQLTSDRADLHRRLAAAIEEHDPDSADENAALIAEHLQAAGDLHAAYGWHMRAATWATNRDITAARLGWERARTIADALPADDPDRATLRVAPRTMLCGTAWRVRVSIGRGRFDELRELCTAAEDNASLAVAMAGLVVDQAFQGRVREASHLASEHMALIESIDDRTLTVGLSVAAIYAKYESGDWSDVLSWSQRVIDLADGDPTIGNFMVGSPLAAAYAMRAVGRYWMGRWGWRDDLQDGLTMARGADPMSYAMVVAYVYFPGIPLGVLAAHDEAVRAIEDALRIAERSADDLAVSVAQMTLGVALVHSHTAAERGRGQQLLDEVSHVFLREGYGLGDLPLVELYSARERARRGNHDEAMPLMRAAVENLVREGQLLSYGVPATGVLVETLLDHGAKADIAEAEAAIERLAAAPADEHLVIRDIWLVRLRALLAHSRGDETTYRDCRDRYRAMATSLGFEGHVESAEMMP